MEDWAEVGESKEDLLSAEQKKEGLLKLIRKGAPSVPSRETVEEEEDPRVKLTIRIRKSFIERMEKASKEKLLKTSVNTWATEAMLEKLKREGF